jgi:alpha-tubulin suppressor-like RCC1 family protein
MPIMTSSTFFLRAIAGVTQAFGVWHGVGGLLAACLCIGAAHGASFSGGGLHSLDARPGAGLYAWGQNDYGQVGDGTVLAIRPTRTAVSLPGGVSATLVASGAFHSLAVGTDARLHAWGYNHFGQLGDGTNTDRAGAVAVDLPAGIGVVALAAGAHHSLAAGSDGVLYAWGDNGLGQLGDGTTTPRSSPAAVALPYGVSAVALAAGTSHSLAIGYDGVLYAWGVNTFGQLGDGTTSARATPAPVNLPGGVTATAVAAGDHFSLTIGSDGLLYAWGWNGHGQLGTGGGDSLLPTPVALPGGVSPVALAVGKHHALAAADDGRLYAWGENTFGQLGDASTTGRTVPVAVNLPLGVSATAIAAGAYHSLAWGSDGKLYAWGANNAGQLGLGATGAQATPAVVTHLATQTIDFPVLVDRTLDATPFILGATASSGLPVSFSSLTPGVCEVSGASVNLKAVGLCSIAADQGGDEVYAPAAQVVRAFNVEAALLSQSITFYAIPAVPLDGGAISLDATATSGLDVQFQSLSPGVCSVSGSQVMPLAVGACVIAADQPGDSTYAPATQVVQSFNITASAPVAGEEGDVPLPFWSVLLLGAGLIGAGWKRLKAG